MSIDTTVSSEHLTPIDLLGERLEGTFTAEQAMEKGLLGGWNVRKWPAFATDPDSGLQIPIPGMCTVVRDNPVHPGKIDVLSKHNVSEGFHVIQNEQHAEFLNTLVDESGANIEMAGSRDNGRKVFISMKLPGHINVGGVDPIENSLLALNSHDGSTAFTLAITPVRYACSNVLNCSFANRPNTIRIRHTSGAKNNLVMRAREALDITFQYLEGMQEEAERLINTTMTQAKFEAIIEREFGAPEDASPAAVTRAENKIEKIHELFADAQTQTGIRDTAWAGFNALTEWNDHFAPTRGDDREASRAEKALLDPSFKNRARQLMLSV